MARAPMPPMNAELPMDAGPPMAPLPMDAGPPMAGPPMAGPPMAGGPGMEQVSIADSVGPEGMQAMLAPDEGIQIILLARMEALSPAELQSLDAAITPETASILIKLLPELGELIDSYSGQNGGGALANV
jgi:hypothetical protein